VNIRRALTLIAAVALLTAGCSLPGGGTGDASTLSIGIPNDITGREIDPALTAGGTAIPFLYSVYETLYAFDADGVPQPNVVESDKLSEDGLTLVLKLRPAQTFHDGSSLNAEDVAFSLDRARGADASLEGPTSTSSLTRIKSVEVIDSETVAVHLSSQDPVLRNSLAYLGGMVLPSDYVEKVGNGGFLERPVGSGPYMFESATQGQKIKLVAFEDYAFEPTPAYSDIELQVLEEGATRIAQLRSGDIDFAIDVDISQIDSLESAGLTVTTNPSGQVLSILLNGQSEVFNDPRVGRALNYAVDVEAIVKNIYKGRAGVAPSNDPTLPRGDVSPLGHDQDRARQLLDEADFDDSTTLILDYPSGRYPQDQQLVQAVQAQLKEVGITVKLRPMDSNQWLDGLRNKTLDDMTLTLNANLNYDPSQTLTSGLSCDGSFSMWCDEDLDARLDQVAQLSGRERRDEFSSISKGFAENPPAIFLVDYHQVYAMRDGIKWTPTPGIRTFDYTQIRPTS